LKNFKLGVKEKVGEREAQVVHYQVEHKPVGLGLAGRPSELFSVWIDTETQLPLKHAMVTQRDGRKVINSDTYRVFTLGRKLEDKLFKIPPK
jgi:hypothetical protein